MDATFQSLAQFLNSLYGLPGVVLSFLVANAIGYLLKMLDIFPNKWIPVPVVLMAILSNIFLRPPPPEGIPQWQHYVRLGLVGLLVGIAACIFYDKILKQIEERIPWLKDFLSSPTDKLLSILAPIAALLLIGCSTFSDHVFRMEQTSTDIAYGGYVGWTNFLLPKLADPNLTPEYRAKLVQASNDVKVARLRFAATVSTAESMRQSYETNSALEPQLQAISQTLVNESSNVCWLIAYWRQQ